MRSAGERFAVELRRLPARAPWLSSAQRLAVRDVVRCFGLSRALVWIAGIAAVALIGPEAQASPRLDPLWRTAPFDSELANLLVAPGARFDSAWYLEIASFGYDIDARAAFFPLYPGLIALLGAPVGSPLIAGIALSGACSLGGLYLLHRLTSLDHGREVARGTVWIVACFPIAFTLSAVYTEGLFLALSVAAFYAARLGSWRTAACVALLAAATRSAGVLLVVPLALLYLYGPRADREPDSAAAGLRPRYRLRAEAWWLAIVPVGLLAYVVYLGLATGEPLGAFSSQSGWERTVAPLAGVALGGWAALGGIVELLAIGPEPSSPSGGGAELTAISNLALFAFLMLAGWLTVAAIRRLPVAYSAYALMSLALPLSVPAAGHPLMSVPRFMLVVFPFWIVLAQWALERGALGRVLAASSAGLVVGTGLFAGWISAP